jgi:diadenosine tetraphosphatase ApaH/serine/threonine PP2A family protein phosphatase
MEGPAQSAPAVEGEGVAKVSHEEYAVACLATGSAVEECEVYWDAAMAGSFPLKQPYSDRQAELLRRELAEGKAATPRLSKDTLESLLRNFIAGYGQANPRPVATLRVPEKGKLVVVGDLHGQLGDALYILQTQGPPGPTQAYIFNGDIADRGENAVEIFATVFLYFLLYPDRVRINRGNHEDVEMNLRPASVGGGFHEEVLRKYDAETYALFQQAFLVLNLATVVDDEVFVVHGGLPRDSSAGVAEMNSIAHTAYTSPIGVGYQMSPEDTMFMDMLWSDPTDVLRPRLSGQEQTWEPSGRGAGVRFGPDLTADFLRDKPWKLVIRSHEVMDQGFGVHHNGQCVTIFSASNYMGRVGNLGAVLEFKKGSDNYRVLPYYVRDLAQVAALTPTDEQILARADTDGDGKVTEEEFKEACTEDLRVSEVMCDAIWEETDADGDGVAEREVSSTEKDSTAQRGLEVLWEAQGALPALEASDWAVEAGPFLQLCRTVLPLVDLLGPFMTFLRAAMEKDIERLETRAAADGLLATARKERERGEHLGPTSCTESLVWLLRTVRLITFTFEQLADGSRVSDSALHAYEKSKVKYGHTWVQRGVFNVVFKALPGRRGLLEKFSSREEDPTVLTALRDFADAVNPLLDDIQGDLVADGFET